MEKKVIVHFVVDAQVDFVTGRLANPNAVAAIPYIRRALDGAVRYKNDTIQHIIFQRDAHPATEEEFHASLEGQKFPFFHCPKGDPGMEIVGDLRPYEGIALAIVDKAYIFDPITVNAIAHAKAVQDGRLDEIHFYGFLTGMCVLGSAIQARANFHEAEIFVHANGTADLDSEKHEAALAAMERNFINIVR